MVPSYICQILIWSEDDFTQLNERFIKSCRDYENLLDASMSQPQQYQYGQQRHTSQGYGGGYPPQPAPSQQEPQRYYTPNPQQG
jgi:signal transducing adaptor molecule